MKQEFENYTGIHSPKAEGNETKKEWFHQKRS